LADTIIISGTTRQEKYASLIPQLKSLSDEPDEYAALGNIISALKYGMDFFWVGLYIVKEKGKMEKGEVGRTAQFTTHPSELYSAHFREL